MPPVSELPFDPMAVRMSFADPTTPTIGYIHARQNDAPDVWTLDISLPDTTFFDFAPGQFNMLTAFGVGEAAISLSGDPADGRLIHTIRDVGPVSRSLTRLAQGDAIGVRGPFGVGWPLAAAEGRDLLIIAGGLGLAPLRPTIYRILAERQRYGSVSILYGARRPEDILFGKELAGWRARLDVDVAVTVDHAMSDWRGHVGVVTRLLPRATFDPASAVAMLCGPEIMMRNVAATLTAQGLASERIFLSMERNMKCAVGHCGHCQLGPAFICRDGPVFTYARMRPLLAVKEL
jgi:NAD(P)H-flavin reductase